MRTLARFTVIAVTIAASLAPVFGRQVLQSDRSSRNVGEILGMTREETGKCGTSAVTYALSHLKELSSATKSRLAAAMQRTERQKSRLSSSGRFRIHYDTTGSDAPALITSGQHAERIPNSLEQFVDSVAYCFDYAWKLEVDTLHYDAPPTDGGQGGGGEYDVYISDLGTDLFGQTSFDTNVGLVDGQRYSTYIDVDNDFLGFRTPGIDGLKITAAHEFFHAIQVGSYGYWGTDRWFMELTAVWMEHNGFASIHDYWYDLPQYFQRFAGLPFNTPQFGGYERSIWAHYLTKRFGRDIVKDIWNGMKLTPVLSSMAAVFTGYGSTLQAEYALFSDWNYYTADRADAARYYDDGKNYPRISPNVSTSFTGADASLSGSVFPFSTQYFEIALTADTLTAVIANINVSGAQDPNPLKSTVRLNLNSANLQPPYQKIAGGLGLSFIAGEMSQYRTLYFLSSTRSNANSAADPSPNPVHLSRDTKLTLPVQGAPLGPADVYLLNGALELVYSHQYQVRQAFGTLSIEIPISDLRGAAATGVYFVVARCGDAEFKWKVAIVQ